MKRKIRKILLTITSVAMLFALSGCSCEGAEKPTPKPQETQGTLSLSKNAISLLVGETADVAIIPTYVGEDSAEFSFTPENPTIATVDQFGFVTGVGVGTTTVSVSYGTLKADCTVSVSANGMIPVIYFENELDGEKDDAVITLTDECDLSAAVKFNGKIYNDVSVDYKVIDETIGKVEDGVFKPLKAGGTQVVLTASWRNFTDDVSKAAMTCMVNITVVDDVHLYVNASSDNVLTLYTVESFKGESYQTSSPFVVSYTKNGVESSEVNVEVLDGEEFVDYDAQTAKVSAKKFGEMTLKLSCDIGESNIYEKTITVKVQRPIAEYTADLSFFSAVDGLLKVKQGDSYVETLVGDLVFDENEGELLDAYLANGETLTVEDGKILGLATSQTEQTQADLTIGSEYVCYNVKLKGYTKVLTEASDFDSLAVKPGVVNRGYYILLNDVDMTGYTIPHEMPDYQGQAYGMSGAAPAGLASYGFGGTFDGQGHVIKNLTLGKTTMADLVKDGNLDAYSTNNYGNVNLVRQDLLYGGMFGYLVGSAEKPFEIKNFALENLTANGSPIFALSTSGKSNADGNRVHDIYIGVSPNSVRLHGLYTYLNATYMRSLTENIVLEYPVEMADIFSKTNGYLQGGTLGYVNNYMSEGVQFDMPENWKNVNLISGVYPVHRGVYPFKKGNTYCYTIYAENQTPEGELTTGRNNITGHSQVSNVYLYKTASDFREGVTERLEAFDPTIWKIVNGTPVFRSLAAKVYVNGEETNEVNVLLKHGNTAEIQITLPEGGTFVSYASENEQVLTVDQNGNVSINGGTEAKKVNVILTYTLAGETKQEAITFNIYPEKITVDTEIEFSAYDGVLPLEELGLNGMKILAAMQGEKALTVTNDNRVLDVNVVVKADKSDVEYTSLLIETEHTVYELTKVKAYSKLIKTVEDLQVLDITTTDYRLDGYFRLENNIDLDGASFWHKGVFDVSTAKERDGEGGFYGVFEGNGYTISNMNATWCGLFGRVLPGAVIRNVGLTNVGVVGVKGFVHGLGGTGLAYEINADKDNKTVVDNVYIHIEPNLENCLYGAIAFWQTNAHVLLSNIFVDYIPEYDVSKNSYDTGAMFMYRNGGESDRGENWSEIYVVSGTVKLVHYYSSTPGAGYDFYAENEDKEENASEGIYVFKNVRRYATHEAFTSDSTKTLNGFNSEYWNFSGEGPIWKSTPTTAE